MAAGGIPYDRGEADRRLHPDPREDDAAWEAAMDRALDYCPADEVPGVVRGDRLILAAAGAAGAALVYGFTAARWLIGARG